MGNNRQEDGGLASGKKSRINLLEFALNGDPNSAVDAGNSRTAIITSGPDQAFSLTIPVRNGAVFSGAATQTASIDGLTYRVEGSEDLAAWGTLVVSEVVPAAAAGLPAPAAGWNYPTFRTAGAVSNGRRDYLRVRLTPGNQGLPAYRPGAPDCAGSGISFPEKPSRLGNQFIPANPGASPARIPPPAQ